MINNYNIYELKYWILGYVHNFREMNNKKYIMINFDITRKLIIPLSSALLKKT